MKAWLVRILIPFFLVSSCKLQEFEDRGIPTSTGASFMYPFGIKYKENLDGTVTLSASEKGGVLVQTNLNGLNPKSRYFGKASIRKDQNSPYLDFADIGEISPGKVKSSWLDKDYSNRFLNLNDFVLGDVVIRILEIPEGQILSGEVLRAEIGLNEVLPEFKILVFKSTVDSAYKGTLKIQKRKGGSWLGKINFPFAQNSPPFPLTLYRGSPEPGQFRKWSDLGQVTPSKDTTQVQLPFDFSSFAGFDTIQGFLALTIPHPNPDSITFSSIVKFGGISGTGRIIRYPVFHISDSSVAGVVELEEIGSIGAPVRLSFTSLHPSSTEGKYLSLHQGSLLEQADTLWTGQIPASGLLNKSTIRLKSGINLTYDALSALNGNFRITNDLLDYSTPIAGVDVGGNEIEKTDSLVVFLNEASPFAPTPGITGTVVLRKRKKGSLLASIALTDRQAFAVNSLVMRRGPKPNNFNPTDTTVTELIVAKFEGTNGGSFRSLATPLLPDGAKASWINLQAIKENGAYIELYFDDGGELYILTRGNL